MNSATEIARFFIKIKDDNRIWPVHISLFVAIVQLLNDNNFQNPVCFVGKELMRLAKISGPATYYRLHKRFKWVWIAQKKLRWMETAFIVTENEFKKWVKEAVKEYFHEFSLKPSGVSKKKNACYI